MEFENIDDKTVFENEDDTDYGEIFEKELEKTDSNYVDDIINSSREATIKMKNKTVDFTELEDFLNTLPSEEQKKIRKYAKENSIYGNPILETMLILQYGVVIQQSSFEDFIKNLEKIKTKKTKEIEQSFKEEADYKIAQFSSAIDRLILKLESATKEIDAFTENKKQELNVHYEHKINELNINIKKSYDLEIIKLKDKVYTPINNAVKNIPKTLEKSTDNYLNKLVKSEIYKSSRKTILLSMVGSFLGGMFFYLIIKFL